MNKSIAIIGAGPGIGMALARHFGREGFSVGLISRSGDPAIAAELKAQGIAALAVKADAADPDAIAAAVLRIEADLAPIEVLSFNAAAVTYLPLKDLTPRQLISDMTVGIVSALAAAQAVAPHMAARSAGTILLTGGGFANRPMAELASLGVQKAGIRNLAVSLADAFGPNGIRVATLTILGMVKPGTAFDPDKIAEAFWRIHANPAATLEVEHVFTGAN